MIGVIAIARRDCTTTIERIIIGAHEPRAGARPIALYGRMVVVARWDELWTLISPIVGCSSYQGGGNGLGNFIDQGLAEEREE